MRAVIQRVSAAEVRADGGVAGAIGPGLLVFLGIESADTEDDMRWLAAKVPVIRCFDDGEGRMNRSLLDCGGELMVISQFTLYGTLRKGTRPSFNRAAPPDHAVPLYEGFLREVERTTGRPPARGVFGAEMQIRADNDGPVTLVIDTRAKDF